MRSELRKSITRERLLQVGVELFSRHGYNATGIKEIVDAAGIPKGSFYNYFPGKEQYAVEIISYYRNLLLQQWMDCLAAGPANDALARLRYAFETMATQYDGCTVGIGCLIGTLAAEMADSSELCRAALESGVTTWCEQMAEQIRFAQSAGSVRNDLPAEQLAELLWSVWEGSLLRMKLQHSTDTVLRCMTLIFILLEC